MEGAADQGGPSDIIDGHLVPIVEFVRIQGEIRLVSLLIVDLQKRVLSILRLIFLVLNRFATCVAANDEHLGLIECRIPREAGATKRIGFHFMDLLPLGKVVEVLGDVNVNYPNSLNDG